MKQETRQWITAFLMWSAWSAAVALSFLRATDTVDQQYGSAVFVLIGLALACGIKLSRMRLTATMVAVFEAGIAAAEAREAERRELDAQDRARNAGRGGDSP